MPTDFLGRETSEVSDGPQTVEEFARERGNLTGRYAQDDQPAQDQPAKDDQPE